MKTFYGIVLCCLDVPAIIERNDIEFHDYSRVVKYAHFSILLLLFLNQVHAGLWLVHVWFLKIDPVRIVSMCVCVCVSVPEALIN